MRPLDIGNEGNVPTHIIVHCTGSPRKFGDGTVVDRDEIHAWHRTRGWAGIGYHWVVMPDGTSQPGRAEDREGAHCRDYNRRSLGVVWVGGKTSKSYFPILPVQRVNLLELLASRCLRFNISPENVLGHRETGAKKSCPDLDCDHLRSDLLTVLESQVCI